VWYARDRGPGFQCCELARSHGRFNIVLRVDTGTALTLASTLAAAIAAIAAAWHLVRLRIDARHVRASEIAAVALQTDVLTRPSRADVDDELSKWEYRFTLTNPGRFPIHEVDLTITFPMDVVRVNLDDSREAANRSIDMYVPVVAGNGNTSWERTLLIPYADHHALRSTHTRVQFSCVDAGQVVIDSSHAVGSGTVNEKLRRRVRQLAPATPVVRPDRKRT
jgi:hypothetical protein